MCNAARAGVAATRESSSRLKYVMRIAGDGGSLVRGSGPTSKNPQEAGLGLADKLLAILCWEFVKHPEKAKNGQIEGLLVCIPAQAAIESVEYGAISGRRT